jgi:hypothetical protein
MRVIMLKNVSKGDMRLHYNGCYALPEDLAQELVDERVAYWENEDPPFDPETREEIALASIRANAAAAKLADLVRIRDAQEDAEAARLAQSAVRSAQKVAAILAKRAAAETAKRIAEEQAIAARLAAEKDER